MSSSSNYLSCAGREIHYMDWQPDHATVRGNVIAWHGLVRTGRDMDELAADLCIHGWRVICPDTLGRGLSQWAQQPQYEYCLAFYARLAKELIVQLGITRFHWMGTSMGGAIGMVCGSGYFEPELKKRMCTLVLNDVAPEVAQAAVTRIQAYASQPPIFDTLIQLENFLRTAYKPFGFLTATQWRRMTETSARRLPDGRLTLHYDSAIIEQMAQHPEDLQLWHHYDALEIPVLLLQGQKSDLVTPNVVQLMRTRGPGGRDQFTHIEVLHCGHAPALNVPEQLEPIRRFLEQHAIE